MEGESPCLRAGVAEIDITAQDLIAGGGIDLTGYVARLGPAIGIHDPLYARALILDDGERRAALLVCDLLALDASTTADIRAEVSTATSVSEDGIMVACTHTHSGPATMRLNGCGDVNPAYLRYLYPRLVAAARHAAAALRPVSVAAGVGELAGAAYDRRSAGTAIDTRLSIIALRTSDGSLLALLTNYGCHPVVMNADNRLVSADYPGAFAANLHRLTGGLAFCLTGADGDVDPVERGSFGAVEALGMHLSQEALRVLGSLEWQNGCRIKARRCRVDAPLNAPPDVETLRAFLESHRNHQTQADSAAQPIEARIERAMEDWSEQTLAAMLSGSLRPTLPIEIQAVAIGPGTLVGISGELFSTLGTAIKDSVPGQVVLTASYANGDVGYIPDREAYLRGGYEVDSAYKYYGHPAALASGTGEQVASTAALLVRELSAELTTERRCMAQP